MVALNGRNGAGRFSEGNPGGPGRPRRDTEREYLRALSDECDAGTWREIVRRAVEDAKGGDHRARAWLSAYLMGRPEGKAPTLYAVTVEELAEIDRVGRAAEHERMFHRTYGDL